ncbi:MAG TPA: class I SAM-dependent methyltransferase [Anaerolineales bacterium]|nr:class I SAM-dependent methyltransferase [Anaerolineales bacterium]
METIRGKMSRELDLAGLVERAAAYRHILLDVGTGDGRFVCEHAARHSGCLAIGVDACRENLRQHSRTKAGNVLFVIASAQQLPVELHGLASHITINFPWGSLLESLLLADPALMDGLRLVARAVASIEIRLNAGALAEAGATLDNGAANIVSNLSYAGWHVNAPVPIDSASLRLFPSTWARRLAAGCDPRALLISATLLR